MVFEENKPVVRIYIKNPVPLVNYSTNGNFGLFHADGKPLNKFKSGKMNLSTVFLPYLAEYEKIPYCPKAPSDRAELVDALKKGVYAEICVVEDGIFWGYRLVDLRSNILRVSNPDLAPNTDDADAALAEKNRQELLDEQLKRAQSALQKRSWGPVSSGAKCSFEDVEVNSFQGKHYVRISATVWNISNSSILLNTVNLSLGMETKSGSYTSFSVKPLFDKAPGQKLNGDAFIRSGNDCGIDYEVACSEFNGFDRLQKICIGVPVVQSDGSSIICWSNSFDLPWSQFPIPSEK